MSFVEPFPKAPEADTPGPVKRVIKQVAGFVLNMIGSLEAAAGFPPPPNSVAYRKTHIQ
jgi:hypothetical protein